MVRGRSGGTGNSFNLGEITVSRCSVGLQTGEQGYGYIQGRSTEGATIAALVDAFMQTSHKKLIEQKILKPLDAIHKRNKKDLASKAEATKVDFFTLARKS